MCNNTVKDIHQHEIVKHEIVKNPSKRYAYLFDMPNTNDITVKVFIFDLGDLNICMGSCRLTKQSKKFITAAQIFEQSMHAEQKSSVQSKKSRAYKKSLLCAVIAFFFLILLIYCCLVPFNDWNMSIAKPIYRYFYCYISFLSKAHWKTFFGIRISTIVCLKKFSIFEKISWNIFNCKT